MATASPVDTRARCPGSIAASSIEQTSSPADNTLPRAGNVARGSNRLKLSDSAPPGSSSGLESNDRMGYIGFLQRRDFFGCELKRKRRDRVFKMMRLRRTHDRRSDERLLPHPG